MSESPIPVIVCGQRPEVAMAVAQNMKPEFEVVHIILTTEQGTAEIPVLLKGDELPAETVASNIGSKNYSNSPAAVIVGGSYDDAMVTKMCDACKGASNVPWLLHDATGLGQGPPGPGYGAVIVKRVKGKMVELEESGKMGQDEVYWY